LGALSNFKVGMALESTEVQADRLQSLLGGLAMWAEHPILGAGLGAYIHNHIVSTGTALIIHNSALWVAAEMGLIGLGAYLFLFGVIGNAIRTQRNWAGTDSQAVLVGCTIVLVVMSLPHDMLYQRLFWLLMGAAVASPYAFAHARLKRLSHTPARPELKTPALSVRPIAAPALRRAERI
jgi:O-antigen ligase